MKFLEYKTLTTESESNFAVSGSKFIGLAYPVSSEEEIKEKLSLARQKYPDATHHCYAWVLDPDKSRQRINDDGEPSYSAGKPILKYILNNDLTNVLIIVIRYYGGKKLGIPGLISAYGQTAFLCINDKAFVTKTITEAFKIKVDVQHEHEVFNITRKFDLDFEQIRLDNHSEFILNVELSKKESFLNACKNSPNFELELLTTT